MKLPESLDLYVEGRLFPADAQRQTRSARAILDRFALQPGVVLGDEVGMGKTFVALAVAAAHVTVDARRPVVVMVPQNVVKKWERDANTFRAECLKSEADRTRFRVRIAETGVEFLKLLDDPPADRATVIVLAHGALNRRLADSWTKLAILQAAIKGRHGVADIRKRLARFAPRVLRLQTKVDEALLLRLLKAPVVEWKRLLVDAGQLVAEDDDPVPALLVETLDSLSLDEVYQRVIEVIPERASKNLQTYLSDASHALNSASDGVLPPIWQQVLRKMHLTLPLLILDEAHRVRNGGVQLAQLLKQQHEDLEEAGGALAHRFERMLFLTATPFQLGHAELCKVLSRFEAVAWKGPAAPAMQREVFRTAIAELEQSLDAMQMATERLERTWKRLLPPDLEEAEATFGDAWWEFNAEDENAAGSVANERVGSVMRAHAVAKAAILRAEALLKPWVLRSARSLKLPGPHRDVPRRERLEGASVLSELGVPSSAGGLRVPADNALPFLLAARIGTLPGARRVFGEGLASSYEALLDTHREEDTVARVEDASPEAAAVRFHELRLRESVEGIGAHARRLHPKMRATVDLAMEFWRRGEKVLIFCHYRQTGSALHRYLSEAMLEEIQDRAAVKLGCDPAAVDEELKRFIDRLDRDRAGDVLEHVDAMLARFPGLQQPAIRASIHDIVLRFMRTPTFLVRFADLGVERIPADWMQSMLDKQDASGLTLRDVLNKFLDFLAYRCGETERSSYLEALKSIQTGTHAGAEVDASFSNDEAQAGQRARLVANVRRVYGDTRDETRDRIMLTFNTPFYPEILIASSVMAEGVDLHLNCRHVIHHDLDWNPSSLEQRTGRIDRLGSKAERAGKPIRVYLPYVEGCQDEKLFRVVMDRERWFGVVMGAEESMGRVLSASAWEVERMAEQPLVPMAMVDSLKLRLEAD